MIRLISEREKRIIVEIPDHPMFHNFILGEHVIRQLNPNDSYTIEMTRSDLLGATTITYYDMQVYEHGNQASWLIKERHP